MSFFNLFKSNTIQTPYIPNLLPIHKKEEDSEQKVTLVLSADGTEIEEIGSLANISQKSLEKIPPEYLEPEKEDLVKKWLNSVPEDATPDYYQTENEKYQEALAYVTSKLTSTVVNNYSKFVSGLSKVKEVGEDLEHASQMCHRGRASLSEAKESIVKGGFNVISGHRKRKTITTLCSLLESIYGFRRKMEVIEAHIQNKEFPQAVHKLSSLIEELKEHRKVESLVDLNAKSLKLLETIGHKLDDSLIHICNNFEKDLYGNIVQGYVSSGNNTLPIKIDEYYQSTINTLLQKVVLPSILKTKTVTDEKTFKLPFEVLIKDIPASEILLITFQSLNVLSDVMSNFSKIQKWHQNNQNKEYEDIQKFIHAYKTQLWEVIQSKISALITTAKSFELKLEEFFKFFHALEIFIEFGSKFSSTNSQGLEATLSARSKAYFFRHHKIQLDTIKSMSSGEAWVRIGLDSDYLEKNPIITDINFQKIKDGHIQKLEDLLNEKTKENVFQKFSEKIDIDLGIAEIVKLEPQLEETKKQAKGGIFTPTSLKILTLFQQYIYSMQVLSSVSTDIFFAFCNLYTYYVYSIHSFFANITGKDAFYPEHDTGASSQLRKTFKVIREYTNKLHKDSIQVGIQTRPSDLIYPLPKFNQMIDLDKPPYAIVSRITAVQSLHVLFSVISNLSPKFHNFLPKSKSKFIDDVITEIENTTKEVHKLILSRTMLSVYDISEVPNLISGMKWDNQTIEMGVASPYVGVIEKALKEFVKTLGHLSELSPKEIIEELWDLVVVRTMELLVEGYSKIKKCDPIGRNQMKFDLSTIEQSIKKKSSLANIPKVSHAREYIDGYYYSDEFILEWIVQHATHYTKPQIVSLVQIGPGANMKKPDLKELISKIEKLDNFLTPNTDQTMIKSPRNSISNPPPPPTTTNSSTTTSTTNPTPGTTSTTTPEKPGTTGSNVDPKNVKKGLWGNISGLMNLNTKQ